MAIRVARGVNNRLSILTNDAGAFVPGIVAFDQRLSAASLVNGEALAMFHHVLAIDHYCVRFGHTGYKVVGVTTGLGRVINLSSRQSFIEQEERSSDCVSPAGVLGPTRCAPRALSR